MKAMIIEDEVTLAKALSSYIVGLRNDIDIVNMSESVKESVDFIRENPDIDVIFADIRLSDGYCFDVLDEVETDAMIVFTTAYDEYVLKAFDYDCIDYLMKPYSMADLEDALSKAEKRLLRTHLQDARAVSARLFSDEKKYRRKMEVHRPDGILMIDVSEISHIHYDLGSVRVHCKNKVCGMVDISLTGLARELDPDRFMRVSRQYIVNVDCVRKIRPTLGRNKMVDLDSPFDDVHIEVSHDTAKALRPLCIK